MAQIMLFSKHRGCAEAKTRLRNGGVDPSFVDKLHDAFVSDSLALLRASKPMPISCYWYPEPILEQLPPHCGHYMQTGSNFSKRIENARKQSFSQHEESLIIIGSDCPLLTKDHITQAIHAVERGELVLGPSQNGGFYLLGIPIDAKDIPIDELFSEPNEIIAVRNAYKDYKLHLLPFCFDIDSYEDLVDLRNLIRLSGDTLECQYTCRLFHEYKYEIPVTV